MSTSTLYDRVGGQDFFDQLVDKFYEAVQSDPLLRAMYPSDLTDAKRHLALFLAQYWGGPAHYNDERGHPRLRLRHAPFDITGAARDAWLVAMLGAIEALRGQLSDEDYNDLRAYVDMAAHQLRNR